MPLEEKRVPCTYVTCHSHAQFRIWVMVPLKECSMPVVILTDPMCEQHTAKFDPEEYFEKGWLDKVAETAKARGLSLDLNKIGVTWAVRPMVEGPVMYSTVPEDETVTLQ